VSPTKIRELPTPTAVRKNDAPTSMPDTPASAVTISQADIIQASKTVDENQIRELAYLKWQAAGKPPSDGVQFWLEAEKQLTNVAPEEN